VSTGCEKVFSENFGSISRLVYAGSTNMISGLKYLCAFEMQTHICKISWAEVLNHLQKLQLGKPVANHEEWCQSCCKPTSSN